MSAEDLNALAELEASASPAPWDALYRKAWGVDYTALSIQPIDEAADSDLAHACCVPMDDADVEFIAAARNALPGLIQRVREADARTSAVEAALDKLSEVAGDDGDAVSRSISECVGYIRAALADPGEAA